MEMQVVTARIDARSFFILFKLVILSSSLCQNSILEQPYDKGFPVKCAIPLR